MFSKFERNREKATMACFKVLSRHFPAGTEENHENLITVSVLAKI